MRYRVRHTTRFRYDHPVDFARCNLRLQPVDWEGQQITGFTLDVTPELDDRMPRRSGYPGNLERIVVRRPAREMVIESRFDAAVDRPVPRPEAGDATVKTAAAAALASGDLARMAPVGYLFPSPRLGLDRDIAAWCAETLSPERGAVDAVLMLARRIQADFRYDGTATEADTDPAVAFAERHGVCQDFAQIMIAGTRAAGLPAAYVSGYLRTIPPLGRPRLVGADATHAWVMVWCGPARGWIGADPTNGCLVGGDHIVTAIGRDYGDVAPIDGIFLGRDGQSIDVEVDVEPVG